MHRQLNILLSVTAIVLAFLVIRQSVAKESEISSSSNYLPKLITELDSQAQIMRGQLQYGGAETTDGVKMLNVLDSSENLLDNLNGRLFSNPVRWGENQLISKKLEVKIAFTSGIETELELLNAVKMVRYRYEWDRLEIKLMRHALLTDLTHNQD